MGKVELKLEIDADLLARARANGADPQVVLEQGLHAAALGPRDLDYVEAARRDRADPEGAERRAREWAEANKDAISEFNHHVREHGLLSEQPPFQPDWLR